MVSIRLLRRRIKSIQGTAKITKAMEMIATARMRRAQDQALAGRPYAEKINQVIADLIAEEKAPAHPLLARREVQRIAIIHITTDRGLCGGLNANMNHFTAKFILEQSVPVTLIVVGRKGRDFMVRSGVDIRAEFTGIGDRPTLFDTLPISRVVIDDYTDGYIDEVYLSYPRFISTMIQEPTLEPLLPVKPTTISGFRTVEYIYEPTPEFVLAQLVPRYVQMKVYHAILEGIASEHSARMVAMRNATENANNLIEDLTISLNKARQEMITKELLDITGGVEALGGEIE